MLGINISKYKILIVAMTVINIFEDLGPTKTLVYLIPQLYYLDIR